MFSNIFFHTLNSSNLDTLKTDSTCEIPVETKKRKLGFAGINPTDTESENKDSMHTHARNPDLYRYNSLLDSALAVEDLDSFKVNPEIFDDGEI